MAEGPEAGVSVRAYLLTAAIAATAAGGAIVVWLTWFHDGVRPGPGPYAKQLFECRVFLDADLMHPDLQVYLEDSVFHEETAKGIRIGGKVELLGGDGRPVAHNYECLMRDMQVIAFEIL